MAFSNTAVVDDVNRTRGMAGTAAETTVETSAETTASAVSWGAVFAGAVAAASLSLILLMLGVGLGLSSVSPWSRSGMGATALGVSAIAWLTFTQLAASALGGYLAGRLRTKWSAVHSDEVYFRDTAHGFLAWAAATLATAALLTSAVGNILSGGAQAGAALAGGAASTAVRAVPAVDNAPMAYFVDTLFRRDGAAGSASPPGNAAGNTAANTAANAAPADPAKATPDTLGGNISNPSNSSSNDAAEVVRIFANAGRAGALPPEDLRQVGQIVAARTGLSQADAERRVTDLHARAQARWRDAETAARVAADKARKASATSAMWLFISLLTGAFVASLCATFGGRRRDA